MKNTFSFTRGILFTSLFVVFSFSVVNLAYAATVWNVSVGNTGACTIADPNCSIIQSAVSAASSGDTINVAAGTYNESIVVSKDNLTLKGAQAGVDARTRSGVESIINGASPVAFMANNITIDGFTIQGSNSSDKVSGIWGNPSFSGTQGGYTIVNNIIQNNVIGVDIGGTTNTSLIQHNLIQNNNNAGPASGSGFRNDFPLSNTTVDGNTFVNNSSGAIIVGGDTASNIIISNNVADNLIGIGNTTTATISGNTITNAPIKGISIFGNNSNMAITGNTLQNDVIGIHIKNAGNINVAINSNKLIGNTTALQVDSGAYTGTLDATNNYWGSASPDFTTIISGTVSHTPWYADAGLSTLTGFPVTIGSTGYSTIQAAINAANPGDVIKVTSGTFHESLNINKAVTLQGAQFGKASGQHSGAESIIDAASITTSGIIIDGFSFDGTATQVNVSSATLLSGVVIKNNIFSGYHSVGIVTDKAGNILIQGNSFSGPLSGSEAMQIKSNSITGGCNGSQITSNTFTGATDNGGADINLSCTDSNSSNITVSGNTSTANTGGSSFVAFSGVTGGITVSNNTLTTSGSSIFFFGSISGSVLINGNIITNGLGSAVSIHGADNLGTDDTANTGTFTITSNTFSGNAKGIAVATSALGVNAQVLAHNNNLLGNAAVSSDSLVAVDATKNWWGNSTGPGAGQIVGAGSTNVTFNPWYSDSIMTNLSNNTHTDATLSSNQTGQTSLPTGVTDITLTTGKVLDLSAGTTVVNAPVTVGSNSSVSTTQTVGDQTITINQSVNLQSGTPTQPIILSNSDLANISVSIPDDTTVFAQDAAWNGTIVPPTVSSDNSGTTPSGFSVGSTVIEVGSPTGVLLFNKPVEIILAGVTGPVAYRPSGSSNWVQITNVCTGSYTSPDAPVFPGECSISNGTDTKIETYHFTTFGSLVVTPTPVSSGGIGGGAPVGLFGTVNGTPAAVVPAKPTVTTTTAKATTTIPVKPTQAKTNSSVIKVNTEKPTVTQKVENNSQAANVISSNPEYVSKITGFLKKTFGWFTKIFKRK